MLGKQEGMIVVSRRGLLLLLRSKHSRQQSKVLYPWGGQKENMEKYKWWVLAQPPNFLQGNRRQSPRVEPGR